MKKVVLIGAVIFSAIACNRIEKEERILVKGESDAIIVLDTPKAQCHKCQTIIESGLQKVYGVNQSILDLNTKQISIVYNPNNTTPEMLNSTVNKLITQIPCK